MSPVRHAGHAGALHDAILDAGFPRWRIHRLRQAGSHLARWRFVLGAVEAGCEWGTTRDADPRGRFLAGRVARGETPILYGPDDPEDPTIWPWSRRDPLWEVWAYRDETITDWARRLVTEWRLAGSPAPKVEEVRF